MLKKQETVKINMYLYFLEQKFVGYFGTKYNLFSDQQFLLSLLKKQSDIRSTDLRNKDVEIESPLSGR